MTSIDQSDHRLEVRYTPGRYLTVLAWMFSIAAVGGVIGIVAALLRATWSTSRLLELGIGTATAAAAAAGFWANWRESVFRLDLATGRLTFDRRPKLGRSTRRRYPLSAIAAIDVRGDINWVDVMLRLREGEELSLCTLPRAKLGRALLWRLLDALPSFTGLEVKVPEDLARWWSRPGNPGRSA